jgi:ADP-heptose:LPS heptosyltransferase
MPGNKKKIKESQKEVWINPTGGFGDILMLSGVLKKYSELYPERKFNLVRRAIYSDLFKGHPAVKKTGYPPKNADIITTDYWTKEKLGKGNQRPFQILCRLFGIPTPAEEDLYLPGNIKEDRLLHEFIPSGEKKIVVIAPSSVSPRKTLNPLIWQDIVEKMTAKGFFVVQAGQKSDIFIKGAYSLNGLTTVRQLVSLLLKSTIIISIDNFVMHAAHLTGKPAVIIWGPTSSKIYGYREQIHFQCSTNHCEFRNKCLGPKFPDNYSKPCPLEEKHCMNGVITDEIINSALSASFL